MIRLLIVDDEQIAIEGVLACADFVKYGVDDVLTANSLAQALDIMRTTPTDIVLCDIEMPGGGGLELIERINKAYPEAVTVILTAHDEFSFAQKAVSLNCLQYILKPVTPSVMEKLLQSAVSAVNTKHANQKTRSLAEAYARIAVPPAAGNTDPVETVKSYIDGHIGERLSVKELADNAFISQNHLAREFKKRYEKTIVEYITERRLTVAAGLLLGTTKSASQISAELGFEDYTCFSRVFRNYFGIAPREYRANSGVT